MTDDALRAALGKPEIITLCGSTRFKAAYIDWYQRLTDLGHIVLTVGRFLPRQDHAQPLKAALDRLHLRKIDLSDSILVLNVSGYIGQSTRAEIAHAQERFKRVHYLSEVAPEYEEPSLITTDIGRAAIDAYLAARGDPRRETLEEAVHICNLNGHVKSAREIRALLKEPP